MVEFEMVEELANEFSATVMDALFVKGLQFRSSLDEVDLRRFRCGEKDSLAILNSKEAVDEFRRIVEAVFDSLDLIDGTQEEWADYGWWEMEEYLYERIGLDIEGNPIEEDADNLSLADRVQSVDDQVKSSRIAQFSKGTRTDIKPEPYVSNMPKRT